jgi:hypothetical protein
MSVKPGQTAGFLLRFFAASAHCGNRAIPDPKASTSKRATSGAALMLGVPLRAGASHVMKLGPIRVAGTPDQVMPACQDDFQTAKRREGCLHGPHGALSMRFAEHGRKGHHENLVAEIVAGVHDPARQSSGPGAFTSELTTRSACSRASPRSPTTAAPRSSNNPSGAGTMKIDLGHVPPPAQKQNAGCMDSSGKSGGKFG